MGSEPQDGDGTRLSSSFDGIVHLWLLTLLLGVLLSSHSKIQLITTETAVLRHQTHPPLSLSGIASKALAFSPEKRGFFEMGSVSDMGSLMAQKSCQ